ncbi:hypothetical protein J2S41_004214 [Catenuloplanes atrovinosus]|uniref:Uncharacterized protein n=1 Tax=Catenuloplanes atrovinosus TaxID=137266 RepID=A0AAE4CAB2_9ACTN|nr:hypothetical protein [Catenuloplanes atrovinosus]
MAEVIAVGIYLVGRLMTFVAERRRPSRAPGSAAE